MKETWHRILVVSSGSEHPQQLCETLGDDGWSVVEEYDTNDAVGRLQEERYAAVVVFDDEDSHRVRDVLTGVDVDLRVPIITVVQPGDVRSTVDAMKLGAANVFETSETDLTASLRAALSSAVPAGSAPSQGRDPRDVILRAEDSLLQRVLEVLPQIAQSDAPVVITGESGTGKELFARTIHNLSHRADGPFVAVNCTAIPDTLLESELFGYSKGAFTGAYRDKEGYFKHANGGTIFLDEIGEMPMRLQVKLLRVLQEKTVLPVGANTPIEVDFRVITATNRNLEEEIKAGNFREDLYYRIGVLPVHIPPLRERPMDVQVLAEHFLEEQNRLNGTRLNGLTKETVTLLKRHDWPGNVRELQNLMQRLCILKRIGFIERDDLPSQISGHTSAPQQLGLYVPSEGMDMNDTMEKLEIQLLKQALKKSEGNKAAAARLLGINRTTLVEKVKRLGIDAKNL